MWLLLIIGILLLILSFKKSPIKEWILVFLLSSYFSTFLGVIIVEEEMLAYRVRFLSKHFDSSLLYEYLLFPVVCIYFYQTTYHSKYPSIILKCAIYTSALTIIEVIIEKYTNLIEYLTWTWMNTLFSTFFLMMFVRILMQLISKTERKIKENSK